ncbi:MAG TPA: ADP-forming succinate--CoA ligase subunit beta, partial [Gaiellales bacterium]|nr:ADP-forming succinate--CoA ligase subunit beta [Gaiellales bacterium]
ASRLSRPMDLYEYQGKQLFSRFGIPVSDGQVVDTPEEAREAAERLGAPVMVKAQVLTGGRGKAGGIKGPAGPDEAEAHARAILGMDINGHVARRVWIERASDIEREYYCSITFDRGAKQTLIMLTTAGGIEIEQVAHDTPERIASLHVDPLTGFQPFHARRLCFAAGIPAEEMRQAADILSRAYRAYVETDAMLVEINPLIVTPDGELRALDSKYTVDDNALYKHPDIAAMRDLEALDAQERMARERGVTYVKLDGTVGIIGNGAGLVMSTLDVVAGAGGTPANFLDVGGGAQADEIVTAMEVLLSDQKVRAVLFNVFGGITRCDEVARGVLTALERLDVKVPMVVRLDGTNDVEGRAILAEAAPPNLHVAETMLGAAEQVVRLAGSA